MSTSLSKYLYILEFGLTYSPAAAAFLFICLSFFACLLGFLAAFLFVSTPKCTVIVAVCMMPYFNFSTSAPKRPSFRNWDNCIGINRRQTIWLVIFRLGCQKHAFYNSNFLGYFHLDVACTMYVGDWHITNFMHTHTHTHTKDSFTSFCRHTLHTIECLLFIAAKVTLFMSFFPSSFAVDEKNRILAPLFLHSFNLYT